MNPETCIERLPWLRWVYNCEFEVAQELKPNVTRMPIRGLQDTYLDENFV
jgi:hypothetical protein